MQEDDLVAGSEEKLPSVSVVVRSFKRRENLLKILDVLRRQDHPDYEVIVMEQSGYTTGERAPLDAMESEDPRLHIIYSEPLGVGGARDAGWRYAGKDIVLTIDDDDLPLGEHFISAHAGNYLDPTIIAVTGRHVNYAGETCGYLWRKRNIKRCLSYNFFGFPHAHCRLDVRLESVQWFHGSNGSVRRNVIERIGGWDPRSTNHDEHPFCLPLQDALKPGERLVFDPMAVLLRRRDIPGGANVRFGDARNIFISWFHYYHGLIYKYRRTRFYAFYPLIPIASAYSTIRWIWKDSLRHRGAGRKFMNSIKTLVSMPWWYGKEMAGWLRGDRPPP